jgi:uncharacterized membrane protein YdcZ (DUF606 family)
MIGRGLTHQRLTLHRFRRSYDLHSRLTTLLVCAVSTVLLTRSFLAATGYPQVGNSSLHIAHVLWGGLLLTAALIATLAFLSPSAKSVAAVMGGIGFGLFIDEVGKFVTKDVNYFYKPAIAIIYVSFVVLFGVIRVLARRGFTADEAVLIALDSLQRSAVGTLTDERRAETLALLQSTGASGPLVDGITPLLDRAPAQDDELRPAERVERRLHAAWRRLSGFRYFEEIVYAVLLVAAAVSLAEIGWLLRDGFGHLGFSEKAFAITTIVADAMVLVGALELRRSRYRALRWFEHAVLLQITVGQVFLYTTEQLAATADLFALLVLWVLLRYGIRFESAPASA